MTAIMQKLKREELEREDAYEDWDINDPLYDQMDERFGYSVPKSEKDSENLHKRARLVLAKAGVEPFKNETVEDYKDTMLESATDNRPGKYANIAGFVSFAFSMVLFISIAISTSGATTGGIIAISILSVIPSGMFCAICVACVETYFRKKYDFKQYDWYIDSISKYKDRIPEFAMQTCCDVQDVVDKEGDLKVKWYINSFKEKKDLEVFDPFLYCIFKTKNAESQRFYLEVWDEPGFKNKKEV